MDKVLRDTHFKLAFNAAKAAGIEAGNAALPTPMVVSGHGKEWFVGEGVCGFGWVSIRPGTTAFARWLIKNGLGHKGYPTGVDIWVGDHGQSYERKMAHASAMARELSTRLGITAYAGGRLD